MSYQVLARKWRPQVFEDVVGQGHITRTLQNAIVSNRLAHAFLFSGPRGVGKTTTARILAKALNCKEGPTPAPCGKCDPCLETAAGSSVDVIEIDGASNRGIEHIRELRETVKYAPVGGKYKVYVIDEVHMLTNEAFNALLKTLEEPPPHVIFIFATTEPQKIPATIHSRCQRYGFKRVSLAEIIDRLRTIAGAEGITISDQGLGMIARAAEGSMRDSQSLMDQAVSYSGMTIRDEELQAILGVVAQETLRQFADAANSRDAGRLLRQVDELLERGQDLRQFLAGAVEHVRNLIVAQLAKDPAAVIELPAPDLEAVKQQATQIDREHLLLLFDSLSRTLDELRWSPHQRFTLEVGLVKACSLSPLKPLAEVIERMKSLEARLGPAGVISVPAPAPGIVRERPAGYGAAPARVPAERPKQPAQAPAKGGNAWDRIVQAVKAKKPSLGPVLGRGNIIDQGSDSLVVGIKGTAFQVEQVEKKENRDLIEQMAAEQMGGKFRITFQLLAGEPGAKAARPDKPSKPAGEGHDPLVQDVLKIFGGEVVDTDPSEA